MSNPTPDKLSPFYVGFRIERKEYRKFALIRIILYLLIVPIFILVIFFLRRSQNDDVAIRKIKKRTTFLVGILPVLLLFLFVFICHIIVRRIGKVLLDDVNRLSYMRSHNETLQCKNLGRTYKAQNPKQELYYSEIFLSSLFFNIFIGLFCTYIIVTFYFLNKYPMETIEFKESVSLEQKEEYYKKFGTNFQLNYYFTFIVVLLFLPSLLRICVLKTEVGVFLNELEKQLKNTLQSYQNLMKRCNKENDKYPLSNDSVGQQIQLTDRSKRTG